MVATKNKIMQMAEIGSKTKKKIMKITEIVGNKKENRANGRDWWH